MQYQENYEVSRKLIKEASQYKKSNLNRAISLIEEAINICPEYILSDYFKLSSYYHLSLNKLKAYEILENQLFHVNEKNVLITLHMTKSSIYEHFGVLYFKDKLFKEYIYNFSLERYNVNLAIYSQGRVDDFERNRESFDKLGLSYFQKINKCFFEIRRSGNTAQYSLLFANLFEKSNNELIKLMQHCNKYLYYGSINFEWPKGINAIVSPDAKEYWPDEIIELIKKYNDTYFKDYFESNLKKLIL